MLAILRDAGVTHYKSADVDITLDEHHRPAGEHGVVAVGADGERIQVTRDTPPDALAMLFAHERMGA